MYLTTDRLNMIKIGMAIIKPNKKFIKFAITIDMGITSLGMTNCFRSSALPAMEVVDSIIELIKKFHGRRALNTKIGKFFTSDFITCVKTKVTASINNKGFIIAHEMPKAEPIYLPFKFFNTRLLIICLCEIIIENLPDIFIICLIDLFLKVNTAA